MTKHISGKLQIPLLIRMQFIRRLIWVIAMSILAISTFQDVIPTYAQAMPLTSNSPIDVIEQRNYYFLKFDLSDPRVHLQTILANNDRGGREQLDRMINQLDIQEYAQLALINGDLFSANCPSNKNCGQGLTHIDGTYLPSWSAYGRTWEVRGSFGVDSENNPEIAVGNAQTKRHMTIGGGPRIVIDGATPTCSGQIVLVDGSTKTFFPASNEWFDGDVTSWCTDKRGISLIGYSADRSHLFIGVSTGGSTVLEVAQWLKEQGAHEVLRLDSGGSSGMIYNNQLHGQAGRSIANALALFVQQPETISSLNNWTVRYTDNHDCWWNPSCTKTPSCEDSFNGPLLDKNWGIDAPCGMDGDTWVGDFEAAIDFAPGEYVFLFEHDDGGRMWLNGQGIVDRGGVNDKPICPARFLSGPQDIRVLFKEDGGDARVKLTWTTDTAVCAPEKPPAPEQHAPTNNATFAHQDSITLQWKTSPHAFGYRAETDQIWGGHMQYVDTTNLNWDLGAGQLPVGSYRWQVNAVNSGGWSEWSGNRYFTILPNTPTNLTAAPSANSQIELAWTHPGGELDGFKLYKNGESTPFAIVGPNRASYSLMEADCDLNYTFTVRAYKAHYLSLESNIASARVDCAVLIETYKHTGTVADKQWQVYRYSLSTGQQLVTRVEPLSGDPDLYIWLLDASYAQPWISQNGAGIDEVTLHSPINGNYLIAIYGYTDAEYMLDLEISAAAPSDSTRSAPLNLPASSTGLGSNKDVLDTRPEWFGHEIYLPIFQKW